MQIKGGVRCGGCGGSAPIRRVRVGSCHLNGADCYVYITLFFRFSPHMLSVVHRFEAKLPRVGGSWLMGWGQDHMGMGCDSVHMGTGRGVNLAALCNEGAGGPAPWSKAASAALGAVCCSTAAAALLVLFPMLPAQAMGAVQQQQHQQQPAFGAIGSETEDKLLELVRQIETRVGGAASSFLPLGAPSGDDKVRGCVPAGREGCVANGLPDAHSMNGGGGGESIH